MRPEPILSLRVQPLSQEFSSMERGIFSSSSTIEIKNFGSLTESAGDRSNWKLTREVDGCQFSTDTEWSIVNPKANLVLIVFGWIFGINVVLKSIYSLTTQFVV